MPRDRVHGYETYSLDSGHTHAFWPVSLIVHSIQTMLQFGTSHAISSGDHLRIWFRQLNSPVWNKGILLSIIPSNVRNVGESQMRVFWSHWGKGKLKYMINFIYVLILLNIGIILRTKTLSKQIFQFYELELLTYKILEKFLPFFSNTQC